MLDRSVKNICKLYIMSGTANANPPLGTILGNMGVNTIGFCTSFNNLCNELPSYFLLKVIINIFDNKSFIFNISFPAIGSILNLLKKERIIKIRVNDRWHDKTIFCVKLYDILVLTQIKYHELTPNFLSCVKGTIKSMNLIITRN